MKIIVGIDGSAPSRTALAWALKRAQSTAETPGVVLAHVVDSEWGQLGHDVSDLEEVGARVLLQETLEEAQAAAPHVQFTTALVHGSPAWQLTALAQPEDLIVVGTHKTGFVRGRVLGTRSIVIASIAPCSVAVIPENYVATRHGVVVGVASGDSWQFAVHTAALEAQRAGHELTLLYCSSGDTSDGRARTLLTQATRVAEAAAPLNQVRSRISMRRPAEGLLDASRDAAMLVLGASRHAPQRAGFLGSVAHEVLLNITAPVLTARTTTGPAH